MSAFPNTFYRVSVKAVIRNDKGEVLALKENQDVLSLPGGGLDHGEDPIAGLRRELKEELGIELDQKIVPLGIKTFHLESKGTWLMWAIFEATTSAHDFTLGEGVTAAKFIDPVELKDSSDVFEKLVYEVAKDKN